MRKLAREYQVSRVTVRKVVHRDLGLKSLERRKVHHLAPALRKKRLDRCKGLLQRLAPEDCDRVLFSDEKVFTVEESVNRQNDRILVSSTKANPGMRYIDRVQKTLSVMVWAGVSAYSRTNLVFVPQGAKINSISYQELILQREVRSAGSNLFNNEPWIFQQDSAPAQASKSTQSWLRGENIEFISKDLNPRIFCLGQFGE